MIRFNLRIVGSSFDHSAMLPRLSRLGYHQTAGGDHRAVAGILNMSAPSSIRWHYERMANEALNYLSSRRTLAFRVVFKPQVGEKR